MRTNLFVSGSISVRSIPSSVIQFMTRKMNDDSFVLIGDASGVDTLVQRWLASRSYPHVVVFHIGSSPRNKVKSEWPNHPVAVDSTNSKFFKNGKYTRKAQYFKDQAMAEAATEGLAIWQDVAMTRFGNLSVSKGTLTNMLNLLTLGKPVDLFMPEHPELGIMSLQKLDDLVQVVEKRAHTKTVNFLQEQIRTVSDCGANGFLF